MSIEQQPAAGSAGHRSARKLWQLVRPRRSSGQFVVAALFVLLGIGLAVQVRSTASEAGLQSARTGDLVQILDDLNQRSSRLEQEAGQLQLTREQLTSGNNQAKVALEQTRQRATTLGILAGTLPATGPGIVITVQDAQGRLDAATVLDMVQELRDAGAEAIQLGTSRITVDSWFGDSTDGLVVDGHLLATPVVVSVIGDPATLSSAMRIPGGVVETMSNLGTTAVVTEHHQVTVSALKAVQPAKYARPVASPS